MRIHQNKAGQNEKEINAGPSPPNEGEIFDPRNRDELSRWEDEEVETKHPERRNTSYAR